jgi:hypothetical protein
MSTLSARVQARFRCRVGARRGRIRPNLSDQTARERRSVTYQPPGGPPPHHGQPPYGQYGPPQYGPPPGWRPEAPRPGCVPLRPLGVGDILDGSFKVIRRNPRTTLGASAIVSIVQVALTTLLQILALGQIGEVKFDNADGTQSTDLGPLLGGELTSFSAVLIKLLLGSVLTGFLVVVVTQDVLGNKIAPRVAWTRIRPRIWALVWLSVLTTVVEFLGLLPCLVLGVWLWGVWAVAVPALIIEKTSVTGALGRSKQLVSGTFWRVWGIRALGWLVVSVISAIVVVPFEVVGALVGGTDFTAISRGGEPVALLLITAVGSLIASTFTAPLLAAIDSLLYVDLRMRKEGLDIVLQQSARHQ